jgi:hypothetical protein
MSIQQLIDDIKAEGLQVFGPEKLTSYVFFTDGTRIGYGQYNGVGGVKFSTVHKACRECGTGFQADDIQQALSFAPMWATGTQAVRKYKDFDEFKNKNWQALVQY